MGFFESWKAVNLYIDALSRYGIDSDKLSSDLSSRVCKITCEANTTSNDSKSLDLKIQRSAALVAFCILGPQEFARFRHCRHNISEETIAQAAAGFKMGNLHAATPDLQIIYAVAASGKMSRTFTGLFCQQLAEN